MDVDTLAMDYPEIKDIQSLFDQKLYYDVYLKIEDFLNTSSSKTEQCLQYFENLLIPENVDSFGARDALGYNVHSLEYAVLCLKISECRKATSVGMAIKFLTKAIEFITSIRTNAQAERETQKDEIAEQYAQAELVLKTNQATLKFQQDVTDEAKDVLKEGTEYIASKKATNQAVDSELYRQHYYLAMFYYRKSAEATKYLDVALSYLSYTPLESLDKKIQMGLARDITHAAIYSQDTYNFGKVLFHPIMKSLEGTDYEDLIHLMRAFDDGDMDGFEKYKSCLEREGPLSDTQKKTLEEKMRLMALMVMCWKLEMSQRVVNFRSIEQCCKISPNKVEIALMKAMSKGLIEGTIDQVKQRVTISRVQPRDLDQAGVGALISKLDSWIGSVDKIMELYDASLSQPAMS